jgi:hypothetical protein
LYDALVTSSRDIIATLDPRARQRRSPPFQAPDEPGHPKRDLSIGVIKSIERITGLRFT